MGRFAVLLVALGPIVGCPLTPVDPPPPPAPVVPLDVTVTLAADAPAADPNDAPAVDGILPTHVPDGVQVFDLGPIGIQGGHSGDVLVDVKAGLGSITVLAYGQEGASVILERAQDPDGALIVSDQEPSGLSNGSLAFARGFPAQVFSINRVLGSETSGAFMVPNTPSVAAQSGLWRLRVGQYQVDVAATPPTKVAVDRPVHVVVLVRGQDTGHGHIDLNLHFTGGGGITAASAVDDPLVQGALDVVRAAYGAVDIDIGTVRLQDVDTAFATLTLADGRCEDGDLSRVVAAGAGDEPGLDLFFVETFVCQVQAGVDVGASIGGIAAGIPGPPWVHGSTHSGVAVSTSFAGGDPRPLGVVMAHETGHFLGLYHTRESRFGGETIYDNVDDTPETNEAADNLMYFAADSNTSLSAGQGHVMRTSAFVIPD